MISNEMFGSGIIRIKIKGYLKNNTDNELLEFEEKGIKIKNKIIYYNNNVKNTIKFSDKEIILIREDNDFLNTFVFNINKSYSNYLLKENNYDIDLDVNTSIMNVSDNSIYVKYLIVETKCEYEFKIETSDIL
ncbi:MAG: hypothetical protein ACI4VL_01355 [Bacilli bacterium]